MNGMLNEQTSIYLQIAQMMENDILRGIYQEEEQVPSTNELARQFRINPATAAKGVNLLVEEGILYKKRGIGMFVSTGAVAAHPVKSARPPFTRTMSRLWSTKQRTCTSTRPSCWK